MKGEQLLGTESSAREARRGVRTHGDSGLGGGKRSALKPGAAGGDEASQSRSGWAGGMATGSGGRGKEGNNAGKGRRC